MNIGVSLVAVSYTHLDVYKRQTVDGVYEGEFGKIKEALEEIAASLNDTLGRIYESADQVSEGAAQLSFGAQSLSLGAAEQAGAIENLAAAIHEVSNQVDHNAGNAKAASDKSKELGGEILEQNPVSYTHLDVYKRQPWNWATAAGVLAGSFKTSFSFSKSATVTVSRADRGLSREQTQEMVTFRSSL